MNKKIELFLQLLRSTNLKEDVTYFISTTDKKTALISTKKGSISYLRYGSLIRTDALLELQKMEVDSFAERNHCLEHSKGRQTLPSTQEILEKLCINLPNSLQEYQSTLEQITINDQPLAEAGAKHSETTSQLSKSRDILSTPRSSKLVRPVEPISTEVPSTVKGIIQTALQQTLGPIAEFIYEDAIAEVPQIDTRDNLASLIDVLVNEIDEEKYRNQFLKVLKEKLNGLVIFI